MTSRVARVVPLVKVRTLADRVFDYTVPEELAPGLRVGSLVTAPFAGKKTRGVVLGLAPSGEVPPEKLLPLESLDEEGLSPDLLGLAEHLAERYVAPLGSSLRAVLPAHLLTAGPQATKRTVVWAVPVPQVGEGLCLTPRQRQVLQALLPEGEPAARVLERLGVSRSVLSVLRDKGAVLLDERPLLAQASLPSAAKGEGPVLVPEQEAALGDLTAALDAGAPERRLLWGVTGSGKTEIYLRLLSRVLDQGGGAILLVPEIALTVQAIARLRERLGEEVALLHSALPARAREEEYRRIERGEARVAVGARSAVFAPVQNLKCVVIDEAHDSSYKQEEEPRYDVREVAWWRVCQAGGLLVEGTATPRLESLTAPGRILGLRTRPAGARMPDVEVIDLRRQGGRGLLAPRSRAALKETVARGEQAVVLLNRLGYASYLLCESCGTVVMCSRCEISLTYYRGEGLLRCHHCGLQVSVPPTCPHCGAAALSRGAPGTERLGEELAELLPRENLFRLDSDVVTSASRVAEVLSAFARARPAVLVGTQMVAKGHDYPEVTLVVVADGDTGLYHPDFRAAERTFHLLVQVSGRAGRGARPGRVLLQTWNPDVTCIRMAVARQDKEFYRAELRSRRRLGYPPYKELVRILLSASAEERVRSAATYLADRLEPHLEGAELRGPARLPTIRNRGRWHLLLADEDGERLRNLARRAVAALREPYSKRGVDLLVDVDPQSFL